MQNQSNAEQFLKLPYDLLAANSFVSSATGEIVEITMQQKVIYCWMKQRCEFFTREKKEYYDTLDSVANELSIDRKTVMRAITFFTKHGVLFAEKRKATATRQKWFFKRFNNLMLVQPDNIAQKPSVSVQVERPKQVDSQVAPTPKKPIKAVENVVEEEDDFDTLMECAADNYSSYQEPVEQIQYRTEPDRDPWDFEDDIEEPAKQTKIIFETIAQFISTNFKQLETTEAMYVLEANGVKDADNVLKGNGGCKILGEWFIYDSKQGYFTSDECPF
ncbi:DUF6945 domain-containing protein [Pseudomonas sp. HUK17]|uniref:DUF6945 domain-containing protein n=1 Tax=Pseudomonas sp. HUK17 TaxID=1799359 RepID=UPI000A562E65|nr:hypothetical protein [Pseudomonas sp. HUK17]